VVPRQDIVIVVASDQCVDIFGVTCIRPLAKQISYRQLLAIRSTIAFAFSPPVSQLL
jgi:hypothetical protein